MVLQNTGRYKAPDGDGSKDGNGIPDSKTELRLQESRDTQVIDEKYGFERVTDVREETG